MASLRIGDVVTRKSYGGDINFKIEDIAYNRSNGRKVYVLKGMIYRIIADSDEDDLEWKNPDQAQREVESNLSVAGVHHMSASTGNPLMGILQWRRARGKPGAVLHLDSSAEFLEMCRKYYTDAKIKAYGKVIPESEQPGQIRALLAGTQADILVVTGHDGLKKNVAKINSTDSYRTSRYFIQSVREARSYETDKNKLCVFAGACQSYFEGIMEAGANFASSPGRILIHALDPAKVADRVALTDSRVYVTPEQVARMTQSGSKGIGGLRTRGHYKVQ